MLYAYGRKKYEIIQPRMEKLGLHMKARYIPPP